jgi:hypothetical protein
MVPLIGDLKHPSAPQTREPPTVVAAKRIGVAAVALIVTLIAL